MLHAPLRRPTRTRQTMGMPAIEPQLWTASAVQALPDDSSSRYECVDGVLLVSPTPRVAHQGAVTALAILLEALVRPAGVGTVFVAPSEWVLDAHTLVQPDLYVTPLADGHRPRTEEERGHPLLFVEVLSPSTARHDRVVKRERYQRANIEYWIVDLDSRLVERWVPGDERPTMHARQLVWEPSGTALALVIELESFFTEVLGPE